MRDACTFSCVRGGLAAPSTTVLPLSRQRVGATRQQENNLENIRSLRGGRPRERHRHNCGDRLARACERPAIDVSAMRYTGDNYNAPASNMTIHSSPWISTRRILWSRQMTTGDAWNTACRLPDKTNCPDANAPISISRRPSWSPSSAGARRRPKSGSSTPSIPTSRARSMAGTCRQQALGNVQWVGRRFTNVYVALSTSFEPPSQQPRQCRPGQGGGLFAFRLDTGERMWSSPPPCAASGRAAARAVGGDYRDSGVVFSGSVNGHRALLHDQRRDSLGLRHVSHATVNDVPARGGSLDRPGRRSWRDALVNSGYARVACPATSCSPSRSMASRDPGLETDVSSRGGRR